VIPVLLVDDHDLIRQGLRRAFERSGQFEVVGEAGTAAEAEVLLRQHAPSVVVLDIRLPDGDGLQITSRWRSEHPSLGIVLLTMYGGDGPLFEALEAGASAFLNKDAPAAEVVEAARAAAASPTTFASRDLAAALRRQRTPEGPSLTPREADVLRLLAEGLPIGALASRLYISESTAKTHISKLYDKLGATNRSQALMTAVRRGLISG
jgi:DNA-binding NarL/FixJ family response regulator